MTGDGPPFLLRLVCSEQLKEGKVMIIQHEKFRLTQREVLMGEERSLNRIFGSKGTGNSKTKFLEDTVHLETNLFKRYKKKTTRKKTISSRLLVGTLLTPFL